jgi:hypothetical protein
MNRNRQYIASSTCSDDQRRSSDKIKPVIEHLSYNVYLRDPGKLWHRHARKLSPPIVQTSRTSVIMAETRMLQFVRWLPGSILPGRRALEQ